MVLAALIGVGGYMIQRKLDAERHFREMQSQTYTDFIRAIVGLAMYKDGNENLKFKALLAEARGRLAIYGSSAVVCASAKLFKQFGSLTSDKAQQAFVKTVQKMRDGSVTTIGKSEDDDIWTLLFGNPPDEKAR